MSTPAAPSARRALHADLASAVADALVKPSVGRSLRVEVGPISFAAREWEAASGSPRARAPRTAPAPSILLLHGVTASWRSWWRIAPAMAAAGHRVVAVDSPGHGTTSGWRDGHAFAETAGLLAGFARAIGLGGACDDAAPALAVIGHSWGSLVAASFPLAGLTPRRVVLLDPPALTPEGQRDLLGDPTEQPYASAQDAAVAIVAANPTWHPEDVAAKAEQLTQFDRDRVARIVLENRWDAGLAAITAGIARGVEPRTYAVVRGDTSAGGMTPDAVASQLAAVIGQERVMTLDGAPHSPQRTHPEELTSALLRAIA